MRSVGPYRVGLSSNLMRRELKACYYSHYCNYVYSSENLMRRELKVIDYARRMLALSEGESHEERIESFALSFQNTAYTSESHEERIESWSGQSYVEGFTLGIS